MAKLYINKDIVADKDKMENWCMTGDDGMSFSDVQCFIDWLSAADRFIDVELHSCGGDTNEGYAIYDALRNTGKEISCTVVGKCASMATVILLAAPIERRRMYPHAKLLIHSPYLPGFSGDIDMVTLENLQSSLNAEKERLLALYIERTGVARELLETQMSKDSWFGGEVAKQLGFISEVIAPASAKVNNQNNIIMNKENQTTVKQSLLDRLLAKAGYAKIEDVPAVALELTTAGGDTLTVEREEGDPQVGDSASPDGEHVMPDGVTIIVSEGVITEIKPAEEGDDEVAALKAEVQELKQTVATLTASAKTAEENDILAKVNKAGGAAWLNKVSTYTPAGRAPQAKKQEDKPVSKIEEKLAAAREKASKRYK